MKHTIYDSVHQQNKDNGLLTRHSVNSTQLVSGSRLTENLETLIIILPLDTAEIASLFIALGAVFAYFLLKEWDLHVIHAKINN